MSLPHHPKSQSPITKQFVISVKLSLCRRPAPRDTVRSTFARSVIPCCTNPVSRAKRGSVSDAGSELSRVLIAVRPQSLTSHDMQPIERAGRRGFSGCWPINRADNEVDRVARSTSNVVWEERSRMLCIDRVFKITMNYKCREINK